MSRSVVRPGTTATHCYLTERPQQVPSSNAIQLGKHPLVGYVFSLTTNLQAVLPHEIAGDKLSTPTPPSSLHMRARVQYGG